MNISDAFTPWSSLMGGALIGLSVSMFIWLNGRIAGISGLLASVISGKGEGRLEKGLFLLGLLLSPVIVSSLDGLPVSSFTGGYSLMLAGLLVGIGTRAGSGCTSGHGVCGLSRHSLRSLVAVACFMGSGFACVYIIRHVWGTL